MLLNEIVLNKFQISDRNINLNNNQNIMHFNIQKLQTISAK